MEWINVKERLPEIKQDLKNEVSESKEVIVLLKNKEVYKAKLYHWFEDDFEPKHFQFAHTDSGETILESATHWMYFEDATC